MDFWQNTSIPDYRECMYLKKCALIAQLVEQLICNHQVRGSSPCEGTIFNFI